MDKPKSDSDVIVQLNGLYYDANGGGGDMDEYHNTLELARKQVRASGLTIILAESHDRDYKPRMTHALVPDQAEHI